MLKMAIHQGRGEREARSLPSEVREDFRRARTKPGAIFNIPLQMAEIIGRRPVTQAIQQSSFQKVFGQIFGP
jgi:hypothetical protein